MDPGNGWFRVRVYQKFRRANDISQIWSGAKDPKFCGRDSYEWLRILCKGLNDMTGNF